MKKLLFILTILLWSCTSPSAAKKKPEIKFNVTTYNFGKVTKEKPVATCRFIFTNVGNAPLVINQVITSCGCTAADFTKTLIMPGKKGFITATYNGVNKPELGPIVKSLTVLSNAKTNMVMLRIEGEMVAKK